MYHLPMLPPMKRGECNAPILVAARETGLASCAFKGCRYHLGAYRPENTPDTCALDMADRGRQSLGSVAHVLGLSRERIRQIEGGALDRLKTRAEPLRELIGPAPQISATLKQEAGNHGRKSALLRGVTYKNVTILGITSSGLTYLCECLKDGRIFETPRPDVLLKRSRDLPIPCPHCAPAKTRRKNVPLVGSRVGRLEVLRLKSGHGASALYEVRCMCGGESTRSAEALYSARNRKRNSACPECLAKGRKKT